MSDEQTNFASLLNDAIKARGLTLESIKRRLDTMGISVSVATLSYWQNGRSQPTRAHSQPIIAALEQVLELPPGRLSSAAPVQPTRRRFLPAGAESTLPEVVEQLLASRHMALTDLRKVSTHVTLNLAPDRSESYEVVRNVAQCVVDQTTSFPLVAAVPMADELRQTVEGLSNCRVGTVYEVPEHDLVMTEMVLPRPLRRGELVMYEYITSWSSVPEPATMLQVATSARLNELVLEVQFPPQDVPGQIISYSRELSDDLGFETPGAVELQANAGLAQSVRLDVPPGIHCLLWAW